MSSGMIVFLCLGAFAMVVLAIRLGRARGGRVSVLWTLGLACVFVAVLNPSIPRRAKPTAALLIDVSPSTRGLWFRDPAALRDLADALSPFVDVTPYTFAGGDASRFDWKQTIDEQPSDRTVLPSVSESIAIVLSDGRLESPNAATPVIAVLDEQAIEPNDARLLDGSIENGLMMARIESNDAGRQLRWPDDAVSSVEPGSSTLQRTIATSESDAVALELNAGDAWPENDRLELPLTRNRSARWWIGRDVPSGFISIDSRSPFDLASALHADVIVLNDVPIEELNLAFQNQLARYVREAGGSVVIAGGEESLGTGGYANTVLDAISPLSVVPPSPTHDFFLIVDASGSMATPLADGRSKLDHAADAMIAIDAAIPAHWSLRVGSIARDLRWWATATPRVQRPADLFATGPTNLAAAIETIAASPGDRPKRLILISDGQADSATLSRLDGAVRDANLTIDWLALLPADDAGPLARLVRTSGGTIRPAGDAARWRANADALARASFAPESVEGPFTLALPAIGDTRAARVWRLFPREEIETLAQTPGTSSLDVAATWNLGTGRVTTLAFALDTDTLGSLATSLARRPRDARFEFQLEQNRVILHARDQSGPMNELPLSLLIDGVTIAFEQIAPGTYRAMIGRSSRSRVAQIINNGTWIDSLALPGRYAQEFDAIGIDRPALESLSRRTGGLVVMRNDLEPIRALLSDRQRYSARLPLSIIGIGLLLSGLMSARRAPSAREV